MDVYQDAVQYLQSEHVPVEVETAVLVEDVFHEEEEEEEVVMPSYLSSLQEESIDLPVTPTSCSSEEMLERRLLVLKGIVESEEVYLRELEVLLMPMKALRASAGTSQPVLSSQQVHTVFYQVPELRDMHQSFYSDLKARLNAHCHTDPASGEQRDMNHTDSELMVGEVFLKMVNQIGLYGGFIQNYEDAVEVVRKCTQSDPRFRTLAESMMLNNGADKSRTKYTFEALLYKPLDRVTKTTLVLRDLLKTTPAEHSDYVALQEALRLSRSFLSGVNESSQCKRDVMLSHGMRRQLMRDGFVVDGTDGERNLRHIFLYTDLLLCVRLKHTTRGKQDQYRFCWYLPLAGLKLHWSADQERPSDTHLRLHTIRSKMYLLRQQIRQQSRGSRGMSFVARTKKKLEQMDLMLLTYSPLYRLELHSPSGKSHTLLLSSLYELEEWREAIHKLSADNIETVPPDLLTLTSACVKLRMTQQPPLQISRAAVEDTESLCGTLRVAIHSARGLQQPARVYVCVEVDGCDFYDNETQTHSSVHSLNPYWDQELSFQVDGAQNLRLLCVSQSDRRDDTVLGKTTFKLESKSLHNGWRRQILQLGSLELTLSLKYSHHRLEPPSSTASPLPVFSVPIETVAQQDGVLVPHVVRCCVEEVESRGMDEVGIYRVSGTSSEINALKNAFNSNLREAVTRLRSVDVNNVSGVLKLYFRELPEPLIPAELFHSLARMLDIQDKPSRLVSMLSLLQSCPVTNRHTFIYLMHHLQRVSEKEDVNKMSLMNLATVFGPSLLRPPVAGQGDDPAVNISQEVVVQVQVVFCYLQCNNLPEAQISVPHDTDAEDDETTHM
uniref:active breakpoint cluster region-related protein isoform X3 n=1 Tax=Solea senegalensis TaxID=28829 RepID=UPI001CD8265D|nr:active breakpoint cluster region-related protein isoform X3 [Solea senegalensis]